MLFFLFFHFSGCGKGSYCTRDPLALCVLEGRDVDTRGYKDGVMGAVLQLPLAQRTVSSQSTVSAVQNRNTRSLFCFADK